jgi:hypothetical protein
LELKSSSLRVLKHSQENGVLFANRLESLQPLQLSRN